MGRGRQSRRLVADRVRRAAIYERFREQYGYGPENSLSPSSRFQHFGQHISFGLINGMEYGIKQSMYKTEAAARLQARPLWQIAISERRRHAAQYDERIVNDKRSKMRDRRELKSHIGMWGSQVRFAIYDEVANVDWDKLELGEKD